MDQYSPGTSAKKESFKTGTQKGSGCSRSLIRPSFIPSQEPDPHRPYRLGLPRAVATIFIIGFCRYTDAILRHSITIRSKGPNVRSGRSIECGRSIHIWPFAVSKEPTLPALPPSQLRRRLEIIHGLKKSVGSRDK